MRQQAEAGQVPERFALGNLGQDFLDGAVAGADEQVGDIVARHVIDDAGDLLEALEHADRDDGSARSLSARARPLPLGLPERGLTIRPARLTG